MCVVGIEPSRTEGSTVVAGDDGCHWNDVKKIKIQRTNFMWHKDGEKETDSVEVKSDKVLGKLLRFVFCKLWLQTGVTIEGNPSSIHHDASLDKIT